MQPNNQRKLAVVRSWRMDKTALATKKLLVIMITVLAVPANTDNFCGPSWNNWGWLARAKKYTMNINRNSVNSAKIPTQMALFPGIPEILSTDALTGLITDSGIICDGDKSYSLINQASIWSCAINDCQCDRSGFSPVSFVHFVLPLPTFHFPL